MFGVVLISRKISAYIKFASIIILILNAPMAGNIQHSSSEDDIDKPKTVREYTLDHMDVSYTIASNNINKGVLEVQNSNSKFLNHTSKIQTDSVSIDLEPGNQTYLLRDTVSTQLHWVVKSNKPDSYILYLDGVNVQNGTGLLNVHDVYYDLTGLTTGLYNFTIWARSQLSEEISSTSWIRIIDPPYILSNGDQLIEYGTTGSYVVWNLTDGNPDWYYVYVNDVPLDDASWTNNTNLSYSLDGLALGIYNYTILAKDLDLNSSINSVFITIQDTISPVFNLQETNHVINEGDTVNLVWNAFDFFNSTYILTENGMSVQSGNWSSDQNITYTTTSLYMTADTPIVNTYVITLLDASSNPLIDTITVTITDIAAPLVVSSGNIQYEEGAQGNWIQWNVTDFRPSNYTLYRDGARIDSGPWSNSYLIDENVDNLSLGTHNYTLLVQDTFANYISDTILVVVVDTVDPIFVSEATNVTYSSGTTGNEKLTWFFTDNHLTNYTLFKDSISIDSGTISTTAFTVETPVGSFDIGTYNYTLLIYDSSGNSLISVVFVIVGNDPVFTKTPNSYITYVEGESVNDLEWTISDSNPNMYIIYKDDIEVVNSTWTNQVSIFYNIVGLIEGFYNFTIWANDTDGNAIINTVIVQVTDIPIFIKMDDNIIMEEGTTGNTIEYLVSDSFNDTYRIYKNGSLFSEGNWSNGVNISINIDSLSKGLYNFTIFVLDETNNTISHWIWVEVLDLKIPDLTSPSGNFSYNETETGNYLTWQVFDIYPDYFELLVNGTSVSSGSWSNSLNITLNIDGLQLGINNLTLIVYDKSGNYNFTISYVEIFDVIDPVILSSTSDVSYLENESTGVVLLQWNVTDLHYDYYNLYLDNNPNRTNILWNSTTLVEFDAQGLIYGLHNVTVIFFDTTGNFAKVTVWVNVIEIIAPSEVSRPLDSNQFDEFDSNFLLTWNVTDIHASIYDLYINDVLVNDSISWISGISVSYNLSALSVGYYNFTIFFYDESGNNYNNTVWVIILDNTVPSLISYPDTYIGKNETDIPDLEWIAFDAHPDIFEVYLNSVLIRSGAWISNVTIDPNTLALLLGNNTLTIILFDEVDIYGSNNITDTIIIELFDTINPYIGSRPDDISVTEDNIVESIVWIFTDDHPANYEIRFDNGTLADEGTWSSGAGITYFNPLLPKGTYILTITVYDEDQNPNNDTITITVLDNIIPNIIINPYFNNIPFVEGQEQDLLWSALDRHPGMYTLIIDTIPYKSDIWSNNELMRISVSGLKKGDHNLTLVVYDTTSNPAVYVYWVSVVDKTVPILNSPMGPLEYEEYGDPIPLYWNVFDKYPDNYIIYRDGISYKTGIWEANNSVGLDIYLYLQGEYNFTIVLYDESKNNLVNTVFLTVIDTTSPILYSEPKANQTYIFGELGNTLYWNASDNHPSFVSIYVKNVKTQIEITPLTYQWSNNILISYNLDPLATGYYNITCIVKDQSDNIVIHSVIIRIKDPVIVDTQVPIIKYTKDVYEGDVEIVTGIWYDINGTVIPNANITYMLLRGGSIVLGTEYSTYTDKYGKFSLNLNYTNRFIGDYKIKIQYTAKYYDPKEFLGDVIIHPHTYNIVIDSASELKNGEVFFVYAWVSYANPRNFNNSLDLNDLFGRNGTVNGLSITFTISYILKDTTDGQPLERVFTEVTKNGVAELSLPGSFTEDIDILVGIRAEVTDGESSLQDSAWLDGNQIPISDPNSNLFTDIVDLLQKHAFILLFIIIAIFSIIVIYYYRLITTKKKNQEMSDKLAVAKHELEAIRSTYLVLIQTPSGLPVFEYQYIEIGVDSYLVSGLSSAMNAFLSELDSSSLFGFEVLERENISILSHKRELSNMVVFSKNKIPMVVMSQIEKSHIAIDARFKDDLEGGNRGFQELDSWEVEKIFRENNFKIGLMHELEIDTKVIRKIQKINTISRLIRQKLDLFYEIDQLNQETPLTLNSIIKYMEDQNLLANVIASCILLMYMNGGLNYKYGE